ncbi:sucrose-6-phosphate hydrolase [Salisediminibacterium halotolerans]|uniref:Sucrose-6-phosphate hydrolase n=1 Tax=Salisediminibacterium halotolerans TaxID=517425 RepID=A0A1H9WPY8_9BACI|nr:sucrose-6-phosphate hydrolase [Salisediminibacterium haloalkalitolerans]SES35884.1 beta-fructofuranosidase [Salisediminibacterium haloalkalitolerans]
MTEKELELRKLAQTETEKKRPIVESDPNRLVYHVMPPVGLLNDPNGWIHWNGVYHLFYQWNPFAPDHSTKFWGHVTSTDLVHWKEEPTALVPSEWYETHGCYSGSAIDYNGKLTLMYTGNVKDEHNERSSYQCTAASADGTTFVKHGPVVDQLPSGYTAHFRDPKVWYEEDEQAWYFVIGAQTVNEEGRVLLYRSDDFEEWSCLGPIAGSRLGGLGDFGYMWECPDLFSLDGTDMLIVSPQGLEADGMNYNNVYQAGYFTGTLDRRVPQFKHGAFTELDRGFEFYAPQTTEDADGRRILIGWMGVPEQFEANQPTVSYGWVHALTLPRVLNVENGALKQRPAQELEMLRGEGVHATVTAGEAPTTAEKISGKSAELKLSQFDFHSGQAFEVLIRNEARIKYDLSNRVLTFERTGEDDKREQRQCALADLHELRIYIDTSSIELFVNDGEEVFSSRYFADVEDESIQFKSDGQVTCHADFWPLT